MNQTDIQKGSRKVGIEVEEGKVPTFDEILASSGLTVRALAAKIACAESSIYRWKSREGPINSDDLIAIARVFAMTTDDVLASLGYDMSGIPVDRAQMRVTKQIYLVNDLSLQQTTPAILPAESQSKAPKARKNPVDAQNKQSKRLQKK